MKRELSRRDPLNAGTSISAVAPLARVQAAPWQAQMAAKKQPANKLAETAGQIDSAASKLTKPADKISSGERRDSKNSSRARPDLNGTSIQSHCWINYQIDFIFRLYCSGWKAMLSLFPTCGTPPPWAYHAPSKGRRAGDRPQRGAV